MDRLKRPRRNSPQRSSRTLANQRSRSFHPVGRLLGVVFSVLLKTWASWARTTMLSSAHLRTDQVINLQDLRGRLFLVPPRDRPLRHAAHTASLTTTHLQGLRGRLNVMRSDIPFAAFWEDDVIPNRRHIFHISNLPSGTTSYALQQAAGGLDFGWPRAKLEVDSCGHVRMWDETRSACAMWWCQPITPSKQGSS